MAAGMTYFPIATATGTGSSGTITFSSISGSYTDLVLVANGKISSGTSNLQVQFNGDTSSLYSTTILYGDGTSAVSARNSGTTTYVCFAGYWNATDIATTIINLQNYSNTTTYKTLITRNGAVTYGTEAMVGLWRSTAAITSLTLQASGANNFTTASTFTLYGIAAA
jgi:hypothetical protein